MIGLAIVVVATAGIGVLACWLTPLHPLLATFLLASIWSGLFGVVLMMFVVEAWPLGLLMAFAAGLAPAGTGAFVGWLVRQGRQRANNG